MPSGNGLWSAQLYFTLYDKSRSAVQFWHFWWGRCLSLHFYLYSDIKLSKLWCFTNFSFSSSSVPPYFFFSSTPWIIFTSFCFGSYFISLITLPKLSVFSSSAEVSGALIILPYESFKTTLSYYFSLSFSLISSIG